MKFPPGEYKTRDGRTARVWFQVAEPNDAVYPLIGEVPDACGNWSYCTWTTEGRYAHKLADLTECSRDLMPPERRQHTLVRVVRDIGEPDLIECVTVTYSGDKITDVRIADKPILHPSNEEDDDNG